MNDIQTILGGSFFFQMTVCATFIAVVLNSLDQNLQNMSFDVVINLFCLLLEIQLNLISCHYAHSVTTHSNEIAEMVYKTSWYCLPIEQQQAIRSTIRSAHEPFYFHGYQIFTCSMETFLKVNLLKILLIFINFFHLKVFLLILAHKNFVFILFID